MYDGREIEEFSDERLVNEAMDSAANAKQAEQTMLQLRRHLMSRLWRQENRIQKLEQELAAAKSEQEVQP